MSDVYLGAAIAAAARALKVEFPHKRCGFLRRRAMSYVAITAALPYIRAELANLIMDQVEVGVCECGNCAGLIKAAHVVRGDALCRRKV